MKQARGKELAETLKSAVVYLFLMDDPVGRMEKILLAKGEKGFPEFFSEVAAMLDGSWEDLFGSRHLPVKEESSLPNRHLGWDHDDPSS